MPLQKQIVPIALRSGIDTKSDPLQIMPGKLAALRNGILTATNSINKRNGTTAATNAILSGGTIPAGLTLDALNGQTVLADGNYINSYANASSHWIGGGTQGRFIPIEATTGNSTATALPAVFPDSAYAGSYVCSVWSVLSVTGTVTAGFYSLYDYVSGTYLVESYVLTGQPLKVITFGNYFVIFLINSGGGLSFITIPTSSPTSISGSFTVSSGMLATIDAVVTTSGRLYFISSDGTNVYVRYLDGSFSSYLVATISYASAYVVAITADASNNVWVAYAQVGSTARHLNYAVYTSTGATLVSPVSLSVGACYNITATMNGSIMNILVDNNSSVALYNGTLGSVLSFYTVIANGISLQSKIFIQNSVYYFIGAYVAIDSATNENIGALYLFNITQTDMWGGYSPVARIAAFNTGINRGANIVGNFNFTPCNVNYISGAAWQFDYINNIGQNNPNAGSYSAQGVSSEILNFLPPYVQRQSYSNDLYYASGMMTVYDGNLATEYGFHEPPTIASISSTSGSLASGTYSVTALYEWFDAQGNHWKSAPCDVTSSFSVTAGGMIVNVRTLRITAKQSMAAAPTSGTVNPVQITIWITQSTGTTFYLAGQVTNDPTVQAISVTITTIPTPLTQLYTTGGEVANYAPPAAALICSYRDRLMLVPSEEPTTFWYSKGAAPGLPAEFSNLFTQTITPTGGPITAIIQMDDKFVIFKSSGIYYITGYGPALNGTNNDFTPEQVITSPVGTTSPQSVILTDVGVMFQATGNGGIWLLDRSLGVSYIGADVEGYNNANVTSAQMIPDTTQVRFTTVSGYALVWDYYFKQWSVFTTQSGVVSSAIINNTWSFLTSTGYFWYETPGVYNDGGSYIPLTIATGWLPMAGSQQAFLRVYKLLMLGEYFSAHQLTVTITYDFGAGQTQTITLNPNSSVPYEYRFFMAQQKCTALQISITDSYTSVNGRGFSLSNLALEVGMRTGVKRLPAAQSYG